MSTTPQNILHLARQGDPDAIAALMNRHLETQGITARVAKQDSTLRVNLEAAQIPNQGDLVAYVKKGVTGLELAAIDHLTVSCKQLGAETQAWSEDLTLQPLVGLGEASRDRDLGVDLESNPALDIDLDQLDAALDAAPGGADLDFDLDFADQPAEADAVSDLDLDLGVADGALEPDGLGDLDFDLGFTDGPGVTDAASDLDFDLGFTDGPGMTDAASDLDFDLGFTDGPGVTDAASDLDFDLGFTDEPGVTDAASDLDFDLDFTDGPGVTDAASDLDFDLDFTDGPAAAEAVTDLDFDLGFADQPAAVDVASDLDFDLNFTDGPAEADAASDLDFDLGFTDEPAEAVSLGDLDFDLDLPPADAGDLDFDLGFADQPAEATPMGDLDGDLGLGDLGLGDLELGDLGLGDLGLGDGAPDVDLGVAAADDDLGLEMGLDDLGLDLGSESASPGDATPALDDLWGNDEGSPVTPDLGFSANPRPTDRVTDWGADFPPLEDIESFDDGLVAAFDDGIGDSIPEIESGDLGIDPDDSAMALNTGLDDLPDLLTPDDGAFEDLGAAADFDLGEPAAYGFSEWAAAELALATGDDLGDDALLVSAEDALPSNLVDDSLGTDDLGAEAALGAADLDLGWSEDAALTDPSALDLDVIDLDGADLVPPPWAGAGEDLGADIKGGLGGDFDGDLGVDFGPDLGREFDPSLAFDPPEEATYGATIPNPFEATALSADDIDYAVDPLDLEGADLFIDQPFDSTMELDQTIGGGFWPPADPVDEIASLAPDEPDFDDDFALDQPGIFAADVDPALGLGFDEAAAAEDLAFESVEFGAEELVARGVENEGFMEDDGVNARVFGDEGFGDEGFGDGGFGDGGFGDEGFDTVSFDVEGFNAEGFGADDFSDSAGDSNGFIQSRNGAALFDDEPDATDDFIHEFGSDPSTHVSLTPDQFDKDGGVRRTGGSGFPLRLVLGLGLGVLVLALAGLVLNGLLGRLRPPAPGGAPVVTEPAPGTAAPPAEADLFRAAVNAAQSASNQAQTATTAAQWQGVADAWAQSINLMKQVPQSDPNYAVAQQKAKDYQPNLAYAQQNVQKLK